MNILLFGNFDPHYGRNRVLVKGLQDNGVSLTLCNGGTVGGWKKFMRLAWRYVCLPKKKFDVILVLFPAQETMLVGGLLFFLRRVVHKTPVVVDMLTSHYDGYILDRKKYPPQSFHARWYHWIDRMAVRLADCAIVDSDSNGRFFAEALGVPAQKLLTVFIGTDDSVMQPSPERTSAGTFLAHFHGNFIPHQGIATIIRAAHLLKGQDITFQIVGRGQEYARCRELADALGISNIRWVDPVPYHQLPDLINKADVCLGPMGGTGHFDRCAPNKIYEYMACEKAIIVGRSRALERIATEGSNMLLVNPADENDLAEKILMLKNDSILRQALARQGRQDFLSFYTPQRIVEHFLKSLQERQLLPGRKKAKVLITGAKGFIGSRLSEFLAGLGYDMVRYSGTINNPEEMEGHFAGVDIVIHLAAKVDEFRTGRENESFVEVNVLGTQHVIDLCIKHHCRLIFFSSMAAVSAHPSTLYGLSKAFGEKLVQFHVLQRGLSAVIIRPHSIYNEDKINRSGKHVDLSRGRNYPLNLLLEDIRRIIEDRDFAPGTCRTYTTKLPLGSYVLYWPRRIVRKLKKIIA